MSTFPVDTRYITVAQPKCWKLKNYIGSFLSYSSRLY